VRLGLRENLAQFSLLVLVNAFVGAMVGMERSILPAIAEQEFYLAARTAVLSFIVVFGLTKALTNIWGLLMYWRVAGVRPAPELMLSSQQGPRLAYAVPVLAGLVVTLWFR